PSPLAAIFSITPTFENDYCALFSSSAQVWETTITSLFSSSTQIDKMIGPLWGCHYARMRRSKGRNGDAKGL
ncbi:MAG: hypothetical protein SPJ21_07215, partial [Prevotella sp.]|nr:hypothetical protein [Prevotella sp.]